MVKFFKKWANVILYHHNREKVVRNVIQKNSNQIPATFIKYRQQLFDVCVWAVEWGYIFFKDSKN